MEVNSSNGRDGEAWTLCLTKNSAFPKFETLEKQINHVQLLTELGGFWVWVLYSINIHAIKARDCIPRWLMV